MEDGASCPDHPGGCLVRVGRHRKLVDAVVLQRYVSHPNSLWHLLPLEMALALNETKRKFANLTSFFKIIIVRSSHPS